MLDFDPIGVREKAAVALFRLLLDMLCLGFVAIWVQFPLRHEKALQQPFRFLPKGSQTSYFNNRYRL